MLKVRVTFVDNEEGREELKNIEKNLNKDYEIINKSKIYKSRGETQYSNVYFDIEQGCSDLTVNTYFNYFDNINKYASYLLIGSKITFLNSNTFDNIWGSKYVGMNYGPNALRLFDVKCSNNILDNTNNNYATIVHELSHT